MGGDSCSTQRYELHDVCQLTYAAKALLAEHDSRADATAHKMLDIADAMLDELSKAMGVAAVGDSDPG